MKKLFSILSISLALIATAPSDAVSQTDLIDQSCSEILSRIETTDDLGIEDRTCGAVVDAIVNIAGELPGWAGCIADNELELAAHVGRCLLMRSLGEPSLALPQPSECERIRAAYHDGLSLASVTGTSTSAEAQLDCDTAAEAALLWSAGRSEWLRCRNYQRENEAAHAFGCLFYDEALTEIGGANLCGGIRSLYEERLLDALGTLPDDYRPLKCSNANSIVTEAQRRIDVRNAERARAVELGYQIRERAMARRDTSSGDAGIIIAGAILLLMTAAANTDAPPGSPYQFIPSVGPGSPSCTSGMGTVDMNIGYMLGC